MAMILPKGSLLRINGNDLSEHNRSEVQVDVIRIENVNRMHNGTLRKVVIADKFKWDVSWKMLPDTDAGTVDGKWGAKSMETFYLANPGVFTFTVKNSGTPTNYNAVITDFSKSIVKRGTTIEGWDVSMTIEEA